MGCIGVLQVEDIYCFTIRVAAPMMTADTSLKSPTWNRLRRPPEGHIYIYILHTTMEGHTYKIIHMTINMQDAATGLNVDSTLVRYD